MFTINERILNLLKNNKNYSQKELAENIGKPANTLNTWLHRNRAIPADLIIPICEYFSVSIMWLLTGNELYLNSKNDNSISKKLSSEEDLWLELYHQLPSDDRHECLGYVKGVLACSKKELKKEINKEQQKIVG